MAEFFFFSSSIQRIYFCQISHDTSTSTQSQTFSQRLFYIYTYLNLSLSCCPKFLCSWPLSITSALIPGTQKRNLFAQAQPLTTASKSARLHKEHALIKNLCRFNAHFGIYAKQSFREVVNKIP